MGRQVKKANVIEALNRARFVLKEPENWTVGEGARNVLGNAVHPSDRSACRWCLSGAIARVAHPIEFSAACEALQAVMISRQYRSGYSVVDWNDANGRTHEDVLKLIDDTIAHLKG